MLLRHARYLLAVVEQGSFTRAAAELHVSQPALSQQIRQLEEMLGAQLLDRSGRSVRLTDAGEAYIGHVRRALMEFDVGRGAIHDVEALDGGTLRLGFTPTFTTYLVGPLVQAFHQRHPGVAIAVNVLAQAEMEHQLGADALDLGIAFGAIESAEIDAQALHDERLCLIVRDAGGLPLSGEFAAATLASVNLALLDRSYATRASIDRYLHDNNVRPRIVIESNSIESLIAIVREGEVATILPEAAVRIVTGLNAVGLLPPIASRTISILRRKAAYRSAASRAFLRLLEDWDWTALQDKAVPTA